jgi:hypothetical protein
MVQPAILSRAGSLLALRALEANITGLTALGQELSGKRLEVLKEAVPKVSRGGRALESNESSVGCR